MPSAAGRPGEAGAPAPRVLRADNPGALTLDGTRTYLIGDRRVAVIDPGPAQEGHLAAIAAAVGDGVPATILLTHAHPDHAAGAAELAARIRAPIRASQAGTIADGEAVDTDDGELIALATPGHTLDHFAFHWPAAAAVFVGDLMTGGQDTTLVAPPEGDLFAYLGSLERIRALRPRSLYPTHGPPFEDAPKAIERYVQHRERRRAQVLDALRAGAASPDEIVEHVYGVALQPALRDAAGGAVLAYLEDLERAGRVRREGRTWVTGTPEGA